MPSCPGCRNEVQPGWKFCRFCGHVLAPPAAEAPVAPMVPTVSVIESEAPLAEDIPADELMRRIEPRAMQGLLNKTVVVEEGQA